MSTEIDDAVTGDELRVLMDTLCQQFSLQEGELYTLRQGLLHPVQRRDEDSALRRVRIMDDAYEKAYSLARQLRKTLRGYRPDPALVISARVLHAARTQEAEAIVQEYLQTLFRSDAKPLESPPQEIEAVDTS